MNTIEFEDMDYINSILNPLETYDSEDGPVEHFKMFKAKFEYPTLAESSTSILMITNPLNPQHTGGFTLPSNGTYYVPNQYNNAPRKPGSYN